MRVAMYYNNSDVRLEELPKPTAGPGELVMKVISSGICGSDVMEWYRIKKAPIVLGHEVTGEIVEVGEGVDRFQLGDRVVVTHHVPCNTCHYCLAGHHTLCDTLHSTTFDPGGFAEYLRIPAINVDRGTFLLPPEVSYDVGSFVEPLGCAVRAQRVAKVSPGQSVLVLGSGMSGLLHIMLAKAYGAGRIMATDITDFRKEAAAKFGADHVIDARDDVAARVQAINGRGADVVIVATAAPPAIGQALEAVDRGGTVLFYALHSPEVSFDLNPREFMLKGVTLVSSYAAAPVDLELALELLRSRRVEVDEMITHRLPLEKTQEGFQLVVKAQDSLKVIVDPTM